MLASLVEAMRKEGLEVEDIIGTITSDTVT
jgi:hypothetical protein